jgi:hypothetical protein
LAFTNRPVPIPLGHQRRRKVIGCATPFCFALAAASSRRVVIRTSPSQILSIGASIATAHRCAEQQETGEHKGVGGRLGNRGTIELYLREHELPFPANLGPPRGRLSSFSASRRIPVMPNKFVIPRSVYVAWPGSDRRHAPTSSNRATGLDDAQKRMSATGRSQEKATSA